MFTYLGWTLRTWGEGGGGSCVTVKGRRIREKDKRGGRGRRKGEREGRMEQKEGKQGRGVGREKDRECRNRKTKREERRYREK